MRPGSLAILGIAAYSVFLVATMPARWLAPRLLPANAGVALQEVEGTIWSGSARAALGAGGTTIAADRVAWRFRPLRLLQARAAYDVAITGGAFEGRAELGRTFAGWNVQSLSAQADAAVATAVLPWLAPWRPEGRMSLAADALDLGERSMKGTLRIEWKDAAVALAEVKPLGTYRAEMVGDGPGARIAVTSPAGPLRVTGQGQVQFPAQLTFTGEARAEGPSAPALERVLDLIGPRKPDGSRAIDWRLR